MGPLLMTGLSILGATIAIGLVAARAVPENRPTGAPPTPRNLTVVVFAFASGIGVLGAVVGLLGVTKGISAGQALPVLALGPALLGALVSFAVILRRTGPSDQLVTTIAILYDIALLILAGVVGILAVVIHKALGPAYDTGLFVLLGTISALATIALGRVGAAGVEAMAAAPEAEARAVMSKTVVRVAPFEVVALLGMFAAIALVVSARP